MPVHGPRRTPGPKRATRCPSIPRASPPSDFSEGEAGVEMPARVLGEGGGHLEGPLATARGGDVGAERHDLAVLVAHLAPAPGDLLQVAGLEVLGEEDVRVARDAFVTRIPGGEP